MMWGTTRVLVAIALAACSGAPPAPPVINTSVAGRLTLEDRRALAGAVVAGDGLVVRTRAGNLVRYDRELRFVADAVAPSPVLALASRGGEVIAALENRDVVRVDPSTLAVQPIGKASGEPHWIGFHGDDVIVFVSRDHTLAAVDIIGTASIEVPYEPPGMKGQPSAFLLAGDVLWWGIDAGEWGGLIGRIDLAARTSALLERGDFYKGVYGFAQHRDRVLVYGGTLHFSGSGLIGVVDGTTTRMLWHRESTPKHRTSNPPGMPVAHVVVAGDRLLVLVWRELYDVSADFQRWTKLAALPARARAGRPDAMGSYPATVAIVTLGDAIVAATTQDGLFVLRAGKLARVAP